MIKIKFFRYCDIILIYKIYCNIKNILKWIYTSWWLLLYKLLIRKWQKVRDFFQRLDKILAKFLAFFNEMFHKFQCLRPNTIYLNSSSEWSRTCFWKKQKQVPKYVLLKNVLKNFGKFKGKRPCWSLFLIKLGLRPATCFLKNPA